MTTAYGIAGLDLCGGSCTTRGTCVQYCHSPQCCDDNTYLCAWPWFNECSKQNCPDQPGQPWGGGCNYYITFDSPCASDGVSACIFDCGPCAGESRTFYYCDYYSTNEPVIACLNSAAFQTLCNGCNPRTWGFVYVQAMPNNIACG